MEITNRFISLIMAIAAFFTSLITDFDNTIADFRDSLFPPAVFTDFGEKSYDTIRVMSFNIRFGDLGNLSAEDRFDDVETVIEKVSEYFPGLTYNDIKELLVEDFAQWIVYDRHDVDDNCRCANLMLLVRYFVKKVRAS